MRASSGRHVALELVTSPAESSCLSPLKYILCCLGKHDFRSREKKQAIGLSLPRREHSQAARARGGGSEAKRSVEDERRGTKINWEDKGLVCIDNIHRTWDSTRNAPCAAERDGSLSGWSTGEGEGGLDGRGRVCCSPDNGSGSGGERGAAKGEEGQGEWVSQLGRQKGRQAKAPRGGRQYPVPIRRPGPIRPLGARGG